METDINLASVFNEAAGLSKFSSAAPSFSKKKEIGDMLKKDTPVSDVHLNVLYNVLFDPSLSDNHKVAMCLGYLTYNVDAGTKTNSDNLFQAIELEDLLQSIRQEIAARQITLSNSANIRELEKKLELVNQKYDAFQDEILPLSAAVKQLSVLRDTGDLQDKIEEVTQLVKESLENQNILGRAIHYKDTLSDMIQSSKDRLNRKIENSVLPPWLTELLDTDINDTERGIEHDKQALKDVSHKIKALEERQAEINTILSSDDFDAIKSLIESGLTDYASAQAKIVSAAQAFAKNVEVELNQSVEILSAEQQELDKLYQDIQDISQVFDDFEFVLNQAITENLKLNTELEEKISNNGDDDVRAQRFKYQFMGREVDRFLYTLNNIKSNILPIQAELSMQADAVNELRKNNLNAVSSAKTLSVSGFATAASKITPIISKVRTNISDQNNSAVLDSLSLSREQAEPIISQKFNESVHNITSENKRIQSLIDEIADLHLDVSDESDELRSGLAESLRHVMKARTMIEAIRDSAAAQSVANENDEKDEQTEDDTKGNYSQAGSRVLREFGPNI